MLRRVSGDQAPPGRSSLLCKQRLALRMRTVFGRYEINSREAGYE